MFSPQDWAAALTLYRSKATAQSFKLPRGDDHSSDAGALSRIEALEAKLVDFETAFNNLVDACRETDDKLGRAEGMLRYCYAICQNPGVKDLADRSKESAAKNISHFSFGGGRGGYRGNDRYDGGGNAKPRPGLGGAGLP